MIWKSGIPLAFICGANHKNVEAPLKFKGRLEVKISKI
jgi:hypothetical protein